MSYNKTCEDYEKFNIGRGTSYRTGKPLHVVEHEGRTVFETDSHYDAAMFAEELYMKAKRLLSESGTGQP